MGLLEKEVLDHVRYSKGVMEGMMKYVRECAIADATIEAFPQHTFSASLSSYGGVTLTVKDILKMSDVKDVLRYLVREHGLHITGAPKKREYAGAGWTWKLGDSFDVSATFADAPEATCRLVQTGTKMVEQPVYEMKCDDSAIVDENAEEIPDAIEDDEMDNAELVGPPSEEEEVTQ